MESISTLPSQINSMQLAALYDEMLANGDEKNATKLLDLFEKMNKDEFVISFAGHFSAGKSSMINKLVGESILPQSPIPTSANVVKINSGEGVARIYFHHDPPIEYKEPYDIDMIKDYCKDKDTIKKIELSTSRGILPERSAIFDTPGIDAADDADRLITEASLHLVDVLFYVMDYNHVQSEVNLQFLNTLNEKGIPYFVIINQIDKHDETEITFKQFESSFKQTFDQWNIYPEAIYYSSLIDDIAPHNQFSTIKQKLYNLMTTDRNAYFSVDSSVKQVIDDHTRLLTNEYGIKMEAYDDIEQDQDEIYVQKSNLEEKLADVKNNYDQFEHDFQNEVQTTLKNAYIMPYELRDKAQAFLESQQSDFKVGLLASRKKTIDEKESRLKAFLQPLRENIEAAIQWKLRDKFANLLKKYSVNDAEILQLSQQISIDYTTDDLLALVKTGAKVNGEYVLNFTNDVSNDIKQRYKRNALKLWNTINNVLKEEYKKQISYYESELSNLDNVNKRLVNLEVIKQTLGNKLNVIEQILLKQNHDVAISLEDILRSRYESFEKGMYLQKITNSKTFQEDSKQDILKNENTQSLNSVLQSIDKAIQTVSGLPGFQSIIDDLKGKQQRLSNRTNTIALFGAFSAGKSSFANALIGESVLPVSPNPTTATINRICPTSEVHGHGTVVVNMKSAETLWNDLVTITKEFMPSIDNFAELLGWVQENNIHLSDELQHMYQAYLHAMVKGYQYNKNDIGEKLTITIDDFSSYVSDETKACYVESIDLYYDCPLTKQGITLVDTPGADSVNSRHTNVAFDYIKKADAILYVTYYNHALSRADKDFLIQLGRVKDAFQLDKMFFIVNAADLAKDNEELTLVTNYVEAQLVQLGIRFPNLFPISSKRTLETKRNKEPLNDKMKFFEEKFYHFIHNDLAALSMQSALLDIKRSLQSVSNYMESANLSEQEKENHRLELFSKREMLDKLVTGMDTYVYSKQISQKIDKQLYYVLERLSIRFHDMFKEAFNPTTITDNGKSALVQLNTSMKRLLDYTGYELVQELRAVSIRIEGYLRTLATDAYDSLTEKSIQIDDKLVLPSLTSFDLSTPEYKQAFEDLEKNKFNKALASFKNTKSFFEKNEKEFMKEEIYAILEPLAKQYIEVNKTVMMKSYIQQWDQITETIQQETTNNIDLYIENYLSMMTETIDIKFLEEKHRELSLIVENHLVKEV